VVTGKLWRGLSPLQRKLVRDLLGMRGQALAIALVIASGVAMAVMYLSTFDSLQRTANQYYARQRFADVFVSLVRAPRHVAARVSEVPGVAVVEPRVVVEVTLDVAGMREPAAGRLVSVPTDRRPALNDLHLRAGRWIDGTRPDEVIASEAFCRAHGMGPGDRIQALVNGRRRTLVIVGVALSPEFVYVLRPGSIIPDDRTFGVFWMGQDALASAFDMEGAFNDLVLGLGNGASEDAVMASVDRILEPYGSLGAIPRERQLSNWTIENEFEQLRTIGVAVPLIFLAVAAFVLNVALTRAVSLQRPQIATLKAVGYHNGAIARHYLAWALIIACTGILLGVAVGAWLGGMIVQLYNEYFRFPLLGFGLSPAVTLLSSGASLLAVALGAWGAVMRAARIPPAEAMRPEAPTRYRHSVIESRLFRPLLSTTSRMVLRNLERQPARTLTSIVGMSAAVAVLSVGFTMVEAMTHLIDNLFVAGQRQDVVVTFVEPRSAGTHHAIARLPGVLQVEPMRAVAVRLRAGHRERTVALTGVDAVPVLSRIVDLDGRPQALPPAGLVVSATLAGALGVEAGDTLVVEVLEGQRRTHTLPIVATVDDALGLSAYMERGALNRLLREDATISGAYLQVDATRVDDLYAVLKATPSVAGVTLTSEMLRNFREIVAQNLSVTISMNVIFAGIIAFGVVYNAARISLAERSRELASMRVLGFTRGEISVVLLGELAVLTVASLPLGVILGDGLCRLISSVFSSEVFRFPLPFSPRMAAWAALTTIVASALSGLVVRRRLDHLDLVGVLKEGS
jgi:putative ABC transport system permease protein